MTTKITLARDEKYARSISTDTTNEAVTPDLLAEGSIGIYGIHEAGSTNLDKLVLITDGGSESAGKIPAANFVGKEVLLYYGTGKDRKNIDQIQKSSPIPRAGFGRVAITSNAYSAPIRKEVTVGYNGDATSTLNYPSTGVERGDEISVLIIERTFAVSGFREPYSKQRFSASLAQNDDEYTALTKLIAVFVDRDIDMRAVDVPKITDNGSGAVFALSATLTAVNGATTMTTSAAHSVGVNDYVRIDGDYYQALTGTTGTTLVIDRPYSGITETVANANLLDLGSTASTQFGLGFISKNDYTDFVTAVQGLIEDATQKTTVNGDRGSGSFSHIRDLETFARAYKGSHDAITSYMEIDRFRADGSITYDLYTFRTHGNQQPEGSVSKVHNIEETLYVAFPSTVADTGGENQSDFEDIINVLFPNTLTSLF